MRIILSYQTQSLPPPYAYAAVLAMNSKDNLLDVDFSLEYLGREELSEEELKAEGFTHDDNITWAGQLSQKWISEVEDLAHTSYKNEPDHETYLHVEVDGKRLNFPEDIEHAEILFQELMQAILEMAKLESSLSLEVRLSDGTHELEWVFAERIIKVNNQTSTDWENGRILLKTIYSLDFEALKAGKKPTSDSINIGHGSWYKMKDLEVVQQLKRLISDIRR